MKIFLKFIIIISFLIGAFRFSSVVAVSSKLPEVIVGNTTVSEMDPNNPNIVVRNIYGGMSGNEAVINYNSDFLIGFVYQRLWDPLCANQTFTNLVWPCYTLDNNTFGAVGVLTSQTKVSDGANEDTKLETAALFYGRNTISGDAYSTDSFLNNFKFWGRNLAQSGGSVSNTQATWKFGNYIQNPEAQSTWNSSETTEFMGKVDTLARNAAVISPSTLLASNSQWSLQSSGQSPSCFESNNNGAGSDKSKYPEGKVWLVNGDLLINRNITYYGAGTIIVRGNIYITSGYNILPNDEKTDHLGIIVLGQ